MSDTTAAGVACPSCSHDNVGDSKFCNDCGTRLGAAPCASCGEKLEAGSKFCRHCGAKAGASAPAAASVVRTYTPPSGDMGDPEADDDLGPQPAPARPRRPPPTPPAESKTAIWLGVAVAVVGFAWLAMNKQGTPPPPPPMPANAHAGQNHPPGEHPVGGTGGGAVAAAPGATTGGPAITGAITVADALKGQEPTGGHFFVIARKAGSAMPMPVAVVRLPAAVGRVPYTLGPENVMGGGPFVGPFDITARWDQDGVAGKQAGDLAGVCMKNPVQTGDVGADIVLSEKL